MTLRGMRRGSRLRAIGASVVAATVLANAAPAASADLDVVYFAGAGGSSEAYKMALGKHPDVALNHNATALAVHQVNFPDTEHYVADVFDVDPRHIRPGVKWRSFWASPDCRHFSKAKGSAPVSPRVRGLAWVVVKVAKLLGDAKPDVIFLENVEEFQDWAPLIPREDGQLIPDPAKKGQTFRLWVRRLEQCGYRVEWRELIAADYGAPTIRKRLFVIARSDGHPIVWPDITHAPRKIAASKGLKPYVPAADIIDFTLPCPSIFLTPDQVKEQGLRCKRPLQDATLQRIAKGTLRYVIGAAEPFIVPLTHRGEGDRSRSLDEPLPTVTGAHRGEMAIVTPFLTEIANSSRRRVNSMEDPLGTITAYPKGGSFAQASIFLTKFSENSTGHLPDEPMHTIMAGATRHGLVAAFMEQANTGMVGHDMRSPVSTIVGRGTTQRVVTAHLDHAYGSNHAAGAGDPRDAMKSVTAQGGHHAVVQHELRQPFASHGAELRAFLVKYYGEATGQDLADPLHSVTSRARFGLVMVGGHLWQIGDIGMRMLTPNELKAAQGFPKSYITGWDAFGRKVSKTDETLLIGNSVSPINGAAIIAANLPPSRAPQRVAA
ncbi:DNA cytosine methyltransferase [Brevundimonas sp. BAL3]|uniref:DNA cytosine methyltransferase n=1 Tax=Brevundimonas sp. BAL3 TaxID=391600 RepID=UPI0018DDA97F|nr:DNA cytosine methyltransferase [Brevundimonas sp. BAL3]